MKYTIYLKVFTAMIVTKALYILFPISVDARIDESRESIERRLFASGGIVYRDDEIEASRRRGMPYMRYLQYLPGSADIRIYFKTSDGRRPTSSELQQRRKSAGWDLHVVYVDGKSVIELYQRSQEMTDFETNHLLNLHKDGGYWKRPTKEEKEEIVSAFGFEMVRSDGRVRAKKIGSDRLMFIETDIDERLAEMNMNELQQSAPISVNGF
ncbi:MAG: hypothetical protein VXZ83_04720 [Verrucomicrobiota bacterium]|nr:hypothetical protein [Verrucomicrobiota bacterium]